MGKSAREKFKSFLLVSLDLIALTVAMLISVAIWLPKDYDVAFINHLWAMFVMAYVLVFLATDWDSDFFHRGYYAEIVAGIKKQTVVFGLAIVMQMMRREFFAPRGVYVLTYVFTTVLVVLLRDLSKWRIRKSRYGKTKIIMVSERNMAEDMLAHNPLVHDWTNNLVGIALIDETSVDSEIGGIPVVADRESLLPFIRKNAIDDVFLNLSYNVSFAELEQMIHELEEVGVTVHLRLSVFDRFQSYDVKVEDFMDVQVATMAHRFYDVKMLAIKRIFDILGGLVGILFLALLSIFVAPAIKLTSPGPVFFKQKRVGKNGRKFNIYKFRSMYQDAEERKKELLAQNEMKGVMFKMKNDPRITPIGRFIRKTSIDEFPQFLNVLKGDMSLVGTRPPTVGEFEQYKPYQKRRLAMKPGITGFWQAYGRGRVLDFDEIVKMDLQYIDTWSLGLDLKILLKTVQTVFTVGGT